MTHAPIAVGGIGGSGTRVVAAILGEAGFDIGSEPNLSLDNLWFTFLFKDPDIRDIADAAFAQRVALFKAAMIGGATLTQQDYALIDALAEKQRAELSLRWYRNRARSLLAALKEQKQPHPWGWKEPNTHIILDRLANTLPGMRYIHVARNGLDMALSENQTQLQVWGKLAFAQDVAVNPRNSVKYWCWAQRRVLELGKELGERFLFLKFEDLCANPEQQTAKLLAFAGLEPDAGLVRRAAGLVAPPQSLGRHINHDLEAIDPADIQYMRSLGFNVAP